MLDLGFAVDLEVIDQYIVLETGLHREKRWTHPYVFGRKLFHDQ